ncbi:Colicin I receptor precursor [Posidoniimonas polymericola]|uniref:Colicin I receptor n=1 Tax=Posidoniimonas polymericola TaxID=2528002 RepID=A0A5C5ZFQ7_9BACT|nr:TonB-dependent receptor [Posidoniimonas polymericola]TWT85867.1 Colicin I receptor precursor [Posidoniimonas polymericola]
MLSTTPSLRALVLSLIVAMASSASGQSPPDPSDIGGAAPSADSSDDLLNLDLEQLSNTSVSVAVESFDETVTSVTRQESTVGMSPAAVYVITNDMIRRSGVRSIPEALRLVPGVNVAKIDSNKWAISIRGFNDQYTNKLLVQIDGRSVYSPLFGGVYWDVQDLLLEDVERIEVVRGPGATVWGSNAVNGVINVITKQAADTTGAYAIAGGGTYEEGFAGARLGGVTADGDLHWRAWGKWFERDYGYRPDVFVNDEWSQGRGGFRMDWTPTRSDTFTFQGDYYEQVYSDAIAFGPTVVPNRDSTTSGGNLLARWSRQTSDDSGWSVQFYWDRTNRLDLYAHQQIDTLDFDFQHNYRWGDWQSMVWGVGYREISDKLLSPPGSTTSYQPPTLSYGLPSAFAQNQTELAEDRLFLTLGVKLEDNYFSGVQVQPSVRLLLAIDQQRALWGAVSRAVRTPTRSEDAVTVSLPSLVFTGNRDLKAEDLMAYELGYRAQPTEYLSWDAAAFYNVYDNLINSTFTTFPTAATYASTGNGHGYGLELTGKLQMAPNWKISGNYSFLRLDVDTEPLASLSGTRSEQGSPRNQALLWSSWDLAEDWELDVITRYVDSLPALDVDSNVALDLRVGWRPNDVLECAVVAQNLLDSTHREFIGQQGTTLPTERRRGVYGSIQWRW